MLLDVNRHTGMELTESLRHVAGAAVSGWYFSHPESKYFAVAQISAIRWKTTRCVKG